jgi:multidrug efflux pump subunit AcrA (membrane-fusion protein)
MSTEQPLDPQLIEQTKQQIRSLVSEIAQISKSEISPEEFYSEFLTRLVSALAAVGGVIWTSNEEGRLTLQYQINLQEIQLHLQEEKQAQHSRLLYKVLSSGEGMLAPPHSGAGDDQQAGNPTDYLLVLGPLKTDLETVGLVEIFQRSDAALSAQKGYLRFLLQMCELAVDFLKSHQLRHFSHRQVLWTQLEDFARVVHASLDPRETAYTIANEGRRLIECDRLSVAIRHGKKCKIEAISGQDVFDKRSNIVRLLGKLATAVTATGDAVWYTGETRDMAPQVEQAVEEYVDESHSKTVAILPLKRPAPPQEEDNPDKRDKPEPPIGALIIEQIEDSRVPASMIQRVEVVGRHSSTALANAMEHQDLFLMPLWRLLGKTRWVLSARTLPKTISITAAILALVAFLSLWPARFEMEAKGTLEPVERRDVFAGIDGRIEELLVNHGDHVQSDQLLLQMRNTDLETGIADIGGQLLSTSQRILSVQRALVEESKLKVEERNRLAGELAELKEKQSSLEKQLALLKTKFAELSVKSPIDGQVVTWDLRNRLISRPVQRGQVLLRVADPNGPWQLELHMPENRMGNVARAQQEINDKSRDKLRKLLQEQIRAQKPESTEEDINAAVVEELAKVPDNQLYAKQVALLNEQFHVRLNKILQDTPEGELKDKLAEVERQESYAGAKANLKEVMESLVPAASTTPPATTTPPVDSTPPADSTTTPPADSTPPADETPPVTATPPAEATSATNANEAPPTDETKATGATNTAQPAGANNETGAAEATNATGTIDATDKNNIANENKTAAENNATETKTAADANNTAGAELLNRLSTLPSEDPQDEQLMVSYILATEPGKTRNGTIREIQHSAEVRGDEGNTVLVKVAINKEELSDLRPGATVTAKVYCGRRPLGYVLLHDLIAFIQERVIFRYF